MQVPGMPDMEVVQITALDSRITLIVAQINLVAFLLIKFVGNAVFALHRQQEEPQCYQEEPLLLARHFKEPLRMEPLQPRQFHLDILTWYNTASLVTICSGTKACQFRTVPILAMYSLRVLPSSTVYTMVVQILQFQWENVDYRVVRAILVVMDRIST
jgi:hypothetical protein